MKTVMNLIEKRQVREDIPDIRPGDTVRVYQKIYEGDKERVQVFEGVVIRRKRASNRSSITVRKISYGVGVEKIFFINAPTIEKIEIVTRGKVRRSRLYYLKELKGKAARIEEER
ncbi:MAG: 50S ribosomal protein L19 [Myxococcota bacterium]